MSYIVFDIETVPDTTLWSPAPQGSGKGKSRKAPEEQVAPPYAQRPIVIGYATFDDNFKLGLLGVQANEDEVALLRGFNGWLDSIEGATTLVTWNGRRFDVPVLGFRSFRHGLSQRWLTKEHRTRYSEAMHTDLFDVMTEYNQLGMTNFTLDKLSTVIGLPGKGEMDASKVLGLYEKKEWNKIQGYCACDIARLSFLFLRFQLLRGRLDEEGYRVAAGALWEKCLEFNLMGVTFGADPGRLLLKTSPAQTANGGADTASPSPTANGVNHEESPAPSAA